MSATLSPTLTVMLAAAEKSGKRLVRHFGEVEQLQVSRKGPRDLVSNADLQSEETLVEELSKARPGYGYLLEEGGEVPGNGEFRWIIDPLDGTGNFLHGIPHFCISIALEQTTDKGRQIIAGLVFNPLTRDAYTAEFRGGAYLNGKRIKVSSRKEVADAMLATGNSSFRTLERKYQQLMQDYVGAIYGIRSLGAAALDLAFVAAGRLDGFWQLNLKPWDIAAGMLLVREANGYVTDLNRQPDVLATGDILACNSLLAPKLEKLLAEAYRKCQ